MLSPSLRLAINRATLLLSSPSCTGNLSHLKISELLAHGALDGPKYIRASGSEPGITLRIPAGCHANHLQIIISPSDTDYLEQLIPSIREYSVGNRTPQLLQSLSRFASDKEAEIESICNTNHQEFVSSVNSLLRIREGTVSLTAEILDLNQSIQTSTQRLAQQKKALVESRGHRQNIDETSRAIQDCLEVLRLANQVHDLLAKKNHYAALRALEELQNVHLKGVTQYKIAVMIQRSVPATQRAIAEAVMSDLNTWLYRIREMSQYLGEIALFHTDQRKSRHKQRAERVPYLEHFNLNSAIELVADEDEEYDLLRNEDLQVDFTPLFECLHIHQSLGHMDKFRIEYANTRRRQKDLLLPSSITLVDEDGASLHNLLEEMAGFAIVERATMKRVPDLRSSVDVWTFMFSRSGLWLTRRLRLTNSGTRCVRLLSGSYRKPFQR